MRRVLIVAALALAVATLAGPLVKQARDTRGILRDSIRSLRHTTFEERRRVFYGDCDKHAYGYIRRAMRGYPASDSAPVLRNPLWDPRIVPPILPGFRWRADDRVLIGAGLTEADAQERRIAHAERWGGDARGVDEWRFLTRGDVDTLTGFVLGFPRSASPALDGELSITVLYSPEFPHVVGAWRWPLPAERPHDIEYRLPHAVRGFSIGKPPTPFVVHVVARGGPLPERMDILGLKVDVRGYVVVHREGDCFTAVRAELLDHGVMTERRPWAEYIATVRDASSR